MRWPFVLRSTADKLANFAYLDGRREAIDLVEIYREKVRRLETDLRDTDRRRQQLERELDSTDPYSISRRAAQNANQQAGALVAALLEKQRLVEAGKPVPGSIEETIRQGSQTWGPGKRVAPEDNTEKPPSIFWDDPIC